ASHGLYRIRDRIYNPDFRKSFLSNHATIASPTSLLSHRIVTTMGQMKRDMKCDPLPDDVRFRQAQQGGFDMEWVPFHAGFRAFLHRRFKCANEFRPAVWIAGIVEHIRAKIDERRSDDFRMRCSNREKDEIPSRHIGDR